MPAVWSAAGFTGNATEPRTRVRAAAVLARFTRASLRGSTHKGGAGCGTEEERASLRSEVRRLDHVVRDALLETPAVAEPALRHALLRLDPHDARVEGGPLDHTAAE